MARYRYVDPDVKRYDLPLAQGESGPPDWIEVKKFLTAGEKKRLEGAGVPTMTPIGDKKQAFELDFERLGLGRLEAYLVAWSLTDKKGNQTTPDRDHIAALDPDTVAEIDKVLDAHVPAMEKEKNALRSAGPGATN